MRRAVVTGAAGFIGSHLSERLVGEGWSVVGIDAFTAYYGRADKVANLGALAGAPRFDLVEGDLNDLDLAPLFAGAAVVFHLAAQPGVRLSFGEGFARYTADNILATQRVLDASLGEGAPLRGLTVMLLLTMPPKPRRSNIPPSSRPVPKQPEAIITGPGSTRPLRSTEGVGVILATIARPESPRGASRAARARRGPARPSRRPTAREPG